MQVWSSPRRWPGSIIWAAFGMPGRREAEHGVAQRLKYSPSKSTGWSVVERKLHDPGSPYDRTFNDLWLDIEDMLPAARGALWKKPHLVTTYGVIRKRVGGAVRPTRWCAASTAST